MREAELHSGNFNFATKHQRNGSKRKFKVRKSAKVVFNALVQLEGAGLNKRDSEEDRIHR